MNEVVMFVPLLGMPEGAEWLVILAIVVLVFGAAKLPDLARGTGQALRIFKAETKGLKEDDKDKSPAAAELEARKADIDARQAELDAERQKLNNGESA